MTRNRFAPILLALLILPAMALTAHAQNPQNLDPESLTHYSLYYENYKSKNYIDALFNLHWILDNDPAFPRNRDQNFDRGVEIYEELAKVETDPAARRARLDSALSILDRAVPVMQEAGGEIDEYEWTFKKGRFIITWINDLDDVKHEAIEALWSCYRMDPAALDPYYLDAMVRDLYQSGDLGGTLDFLRELNDTRGDEDAIKGLVSGYFAVISPEDQINFLEEQLADKPGDAEIVTQLFELYQQEGFHDRMMGLAPTVLAMDPTPETLRLLQVMYLEDGDYEQSIELFEQLTAMAGYTDMAEDYHNAGIAYQELEQFGQAASFYRQTLEIDESFDAATIAIANLWATAPSVCGVADREQAAVFWLVADAYSRAGDAAGAARMRTAFPTAEDIFYVQKWTEGESTQVTYSCRGLTISGTTTVRQRR